MVADIATDIGYAVVMTESDGSEVDKAVEQAHRAEQRADARTASADARIAEAEARMVDANAQTRHAETAMGAAIAHMAAAKAHMHDADLRAVNADEIMALADRHLDEAAASLSIARSDSAEYQRALYHYTQLVRHRIANPLQAISGLAQTLEEHPELPDDQRTEMLTAIRQQAEILQRVSFAPDADDHSERGLRPRPFPGRELPGDTTGT